MTTTTTVKPMDAKELVATVRKFNELTLPDYTKGSSYEQFHLDWGVPTSLTDEDAAILQKCRFTIKQKMEGRDGLAFRANLSFGRTHKVVVYNDGRGGADFFEDYDAESRAALKFFEALATRIGLDGCENVTELCGTLDILADIKRNKAKGYVFDLSGVA